MMNKLLEGKPNRPQTAILKDRVNGFDETLGFPGVGGTRQKNRIDYVKIKQQKTTLGAYSGTISDFTKKLKRTIEMASLEVAIEKEMKAWLIIHSVSIAAASAAIALENGDSRQLGNSKKNVENMMQSIKAMKGEIGTRSIAAPANASRSEMQLLAKQALQNTAKSSISPHAKQTPNRLYGRILLTRHQRKLFVELDGLFVTFAQNSRIEDGF